MDALNSTPLISVVIPFYNAAQFFRESIESVLSQTYQNWELILVDDGSGDESSQIAREYEAAHPGKIKLAEHPGRQNRGMSASRNLGIARGQGELIAFLDADDIWLPGKLQQQVSLLQAHPQAGMLYGNTKYWFSWTGKPEDLRRDFIPPLGVIPEKIYQPPFLLAWFLEGKAAVPCPCSLLVRRSTVERVGGFEESFNGLYEDQAFYAKVCTQEPVYVSGDYLDWYRQHPASSVAVARRSNTELMARESYLNWLMDYLNEQHITDRSVLKALRREIWGISAPSWLTAHWGARKGVRWIKKWLLILSDRFMADKFWNRTWSYLFI